jgi:RNA polymerase subunit RPABC4/transcription elongation factor Spt4
MDLGSILTTIQPFLVMFVALTAAFLTALWVSAVIWAFRDIRARSRDIFAHVLATLLVLIFFPLFPVPGLILYLILRPRETLAEVYERSLEEETLLRGIGERSACPSCNRSIEEDFVVCPACQTRLKKPCLACGRLLHLRWTICPYCGAAQTTAAAGPALYPQAVAMPLDAAAKAPMLSAAALDSCPEPVTSEHEPVSAETVAPSELDPEAESAAESDAEAVQEAGAEAGPESSASELDEA